MPPRPSDPNLLVGTETSDDAGVYLVADGLAMVQTLDFFPPLVDDPYTFGQIAAANALSDIYAMNGRPVTAMNIVGFPDDELPLSILGEILRGGASQVALAGAVTLGGHSVRDAEIKFGLSVTGLVDPAAILTNAAARVGDVLVLTKPLGTGFVTTANKKGHCPPDVLDRAVAAMIQLNAVGRDALTEAGGRAGPSPTSPASAWPATPWRWPRGRAGRSRSTSAALPMIEGTEALAEAKFFTRASKTNREFVGDRLEIGPGADPLRLEYLFDAQTSGGLLIAIHPDHVDRLVDRPRGARGRWPRPSSAGSSTAGVRSRWWPVDRPRGSTMTGLRRGGNSWGGRGPGGGGAWPRPA